jgi:ribose/xylose/arabinose/galactoside ABC-type transport system permease subunit
VLGIPLLVYIFAAVVAVGWVLLNRTTFGRRTFAIGGNPEAARLAGPARAPAHRCCLRDLRALLRASRRS